MDNTIITAGVSEDYFDWHSSFNVSSINPGDIIAWGTKGILHVAYVTRTVNGILLDDRKSKGEPERNGLTLNFLITERGNSPSGYFTKKKRWSIVVRNNVENNYNIGKVGIFGNGYGGEYNSPKTADQLDWESYMTVKAVFDGSFYNGYKRIFSGWVKDNNTNVVSHSKNYNFQITDDDVFNRTYTAVFKKELNIETHNYFIGVGDSGVIKIDDIEYGANKTVQIIEGNDLTIEAPDQLKNSIQYTFDHWSDNSTQNPRTYNNILNEFSVTAYYTGKPTATPNVQANGKIIYGNPIHITWSEHPNVNVNQYHLYRKVKYSKYGIFEGPTLIATIQRGLKTYTDYDYVYTHGYTDDILWYDVRAYYNIEQTFADSNYTATYGYGGIIEKSNGGSDEPTIEIPDESNLSQNYPNPFNPSTVIKYAIKNAGLVTIKIYDLLGKTIATLVNENKGAGFYQVNFNAASSGGGLPSGVYFYSIKTGDFFNIKKMLLTK